MIYGSVCSGIEAASVAWEPLGWQCAFVAENAKFPAMVLNKRFPDIPNYGDITKWESWPEKWIDILVGGTPCQSFSIAGRKRGLDDARGRLMFSYLEIARKCHARWIVWENVPNILSLDNGRHFAAFLQAVQESGYYAAWRVLDAQYVRVDGFARAVPQRRRRLFLVGYIGDWRPACAVLFERQTLLGRAAPRRKAGRKAAAGSGGGAARCRECADTITANASQLIGRPCGEICLDEEPDMWTLQTAHTGANGCNYSDSGAAYTLEAISCPQAVVASEPDLFALQAAHVSEGKTYLGEGAAYTLLESARPQAVVRTQMRPRRITPRECERLQGFPDDWTKLDEETPASLRYRAIGNSMAVNVMRWIGRRLQMVETIMKGPI